MQSGIIHYGKQEGVEKSSESENNKEEMHCVAG